MPAVTPDIALFGRINPDTVVETATYSEVGPYFGLPYEFQITYSLTYFSNDVGSDISTIQFVSDLANGFTEYNVNNIIVGQKFICTNTFFGTAEYDIVSIAYSQKYNII